MTAIPSTRLAEMRARWTPEQIENLRREASRQWLLETQLPGAVPYLTTTSTWGQMIAALDAFADCLTALEALTAEREALIAEGERLTKERDEAKQRAYEMARAHALSFGALNNLSIELLDGEVDDYNVVVERILSRVTRAEADLASARAALARVEGENAELRHGQNLSCDSLMCPYEKRMHAAEAEIGRLRTVVAVAREVALQSPHGTLHRLREALNEIAAPGGQ